VIALPDEAVREIRAHAGETYPEECCGALLGTAEKAEARVARTERLSNIATVERGRRYVIDPAEYLRVERRAAEEGLALLGFYHSHPDHPAAPSAFDREHAMPIFHYLVQAVAGGQPGDLTAWLLSEDRQAFDRETIAVGKSGA